MRHMVCVHLAWAIYIVTYYGMLLNIRTFSRDHLEINTVVAGEFNGHTNVIERHSSLKIYFRLITALCEIVGVFVGLLLILHSENKWWWSGIFNIVGASVAYLVWFIPPKSKF